MIPRHLFAVSVACVLILVGGLQAEPSPDLKETVDHLAASIYTGPSMTTLRELSDNFGGRLSGSPAYNRAAEWAVAQFRGYGISNVRLEPFTMENGWVRGTAEGQLTAPFTRSLHLQSLGWSPSTPTGGVQGEVLVVDDVSPDHIKSLGNLPKGKIIAYDLGKIFAHGWTTALPQMEATYRRFKDAGATGLLFPDSEKDEVLNAFSPDWGSRLCVLPAAQVGMEDWELMRRLAEKGPVSLQFELQNTTSGPIQVNNIVAEIKGREHPDEWVILGAHFDSWDYGTGAQDNGTGSAMVLEAARAIAALGKPPKRTIRFALWGGEEEGILGSYAYTQTHAAEMPKCVAVLNTDNGSGHPKGWKVEGRPDLETAMTSISEGLLQNLSGGGLSEEVTYDTDHGPFMLQGVPALDLWVDGSHYGEVHHKSSDTYDKVDPLFLKADAAIVAVTAWAIAEDPNRIAPRLDHAAVAAILRKANLDELLVSVGQWKP